MTQESVQSLVEQLSGGDGMVRERARHTLALVGPQVLPPLLELVESPDKRQRWEAAKALSAIGEPSSIPALVQLLSDPESDIRWLAGLGLIRIGPRSIPHVLTALSEKPDSTNVRRGAHHVFQELGRENRVAREILAPVMEVLGDVDPVSAVLPRVDEALRQFQALQALT